MSTEETIAVVPVADKSDSRRSSIADLPESVDCVYVVDDCSGPLTWRKVSATHHELPDSKDGSRLDKGPPTETDGSGMMIPNDTVQPGTRAELDDQAHNEGHVAESATSPRSSTGAEFGNQESDGSTSTEWLSRYVDAETLSNTHVVVGVPSYNEEVGIGSVVLASQQYADDVVVVDDGSTDRTLELAARAGATVLRHPENRGKGGAIRTLLDYVRGQDADVLVVLDGDGQHVPAEIPAVAGPVLDGECDISIGSRYLKGDATETPAYRRVGQRVLDFVMLGSSGQKLSDTQSGFRAFSPAAIDELAIRTDGMGVESEIIDDAAEKDLTIEEVPIDVRYLGLDGQTHDPLLHGLGVLSFAIQLVRDRHPLLFFGVPALVLLTVAGLLGGHSILRYQETGVLHQWRMLGSGFLVVIGTVVLFCGLVLSQVQNMIRRLG